MKETSFRDALSLLDAHARPAGAGVAAFDGDGTLWAGDIGEDYLHALLEEDRFTDEAARLFADEASRAGIATTGRARDDLAALFRAYVAGAFAEDRICGLIALAVAGRELGPVAAFATEVVRARGVASRLHDEAIGIATACRDRGLEVVLVSASPRAVVVAAAAVVGLAENAVIAVTPRETGGRVGTTLDEPIPYGEGKAIRLRERIGARELVVCAGDNAFDMAMLRLARFPYAIRPKDRLRAIADELPALTVLGRR